MNNKSLHRTGAKGFICNLLISCNDADHLSKIPNLQVETDFVIKKYVVY